MSGKTWLLGYLKGTTERVILRDFEWSCGWFWSGGYIGNNNFHAHFDGAFLDAVDSRGHCLNSSGATFLDPWQPVPQYVKAENVKRITNGASVWEGLGFFLDSPRYTDNQWWRIKDLFKQFYRLRDAAEVFRYGGHCTSTGRTDAEINPEMADRINKHIETVIIPEIRKAMDSPKVAVKETATA